MTLHWKRKMFGISKFNLLTHSPTNLIYRVTAVRKSRLICPVYDTTRYWFGGDIFRIPNAMTWCCEEYNNIILRHIVFNNFIKECIYESNCRTVLNKNSYHFCCVTNILYILYLFLYTSICRMLRRVDVVDPGPLSEATTRHLTVFYTGRLGIGLIYIWKSF